SGRVMSPRSTPRCPTGSAVPATNLRRSSASSDDPANAWSSQRPPPESTYEPTSSAGRLNPSLERWTRGTTGKDGDRRVDHSVDNNADGRRRILSTSAYDN